MDEKIKQKLMQNMPYIKDLLDFKPKNNFIINEQTNLISGFNGILIPLAKFLQIYDESKKAIDDQLAWNDLDRYIPIRQHQQSAETQLLSYRDMMERMVSAWVKIAEEYDTLSQKKTEIKMVQVVKPISTEEKESFVNTIKDEVDFFYNRMKMKRVPKHKIKEAELEFIADKSQGDRTKELIIKEYLSKYENETENNNQPKDTDESDVSELPTDE